MEKRFWLALARGLPLPKSSIGGHQYRRWIGAKRYAGIEVERTGDMEAQTFDQLSSQNGSFIWKVSNYYEINKLFSLTSPYVFRQSFEYSMRDMKKHGFTNLGSCHVNIQVQEKEKIFKKYNQCWWYYRKARDGMSVNKDSHSRIELKAGPTAFTSMEFFAKLLCILSVDLTKRKGSLDRAKALASLFDNELFFPGQIITQTCKEYVDFLHKMYVDDDM